MSYNTKYDDRPWFGRVTRESELPPNSVLVIIHPKDENGFVSASVKIGGVVITTTETHIALAEAEHTRLVNLIQPRDVYVLIERDADWDNKYGYLRQEIGG